MFRVSAECCHEPENPPAVATGDNRRTRRKWTDLIWLCSDNREPTALQIFTQRSNCREYVLRGIEKCSRLATAVRNTLTSPHVCNVIGNGMTNDVLAPGAQRTIDTFSQRTPTIVSCVCVTVCVSVRAVCGRRQFVPTLSNV